MAHGPCEVPRKLGCHELLGLSTRVEHVPTNMLNSIRRRLCIRLLHVKEILSRTTTPRLQVGRRITKILQCSGSQNVYRSCAQCLVRDNDAVHSVSSNWVGSCDRVWHVYDMVCTSVQKPGCNLVPLGNRLSGAVSRAHHFVESETPNNNHSREVYSASVSPTSPSYDKSTSRGPESWCQNGDAAPRS